jgi:hypothetical protein
MLDLLAIEFRVELGVEFRVELVLEVALVGCRDE